MSKLYGFKFIQRRAYGQIEQYIILSDVGEKQYLERYIRGNTHRVYISELIDDFCSELKKVDIHSWNFCEFKNFTDWFVNGYYWSLDLSTDEVSVSCKGENIYPPNWQDFAEAVRKLHIKI